MREIKFRGKRIDNGEFVYGDLKHMTGNRVGIHFDNRIACVEVETESVAQLCGYDKDGREVYEGDVLYRDFNGVHYEYEVRLFGDAVAENGCYITEKMFREMQVKTA